MYIRVNVSFFWIHSYNLFKGFHSIDYFPFQLNSLRSGRVKVTLKEVGDGTGPHIPRSFLEYSNVTRTPLCKNERTIHSR